MRNSPTPQATTLPFFQDEFAVSHPVTAWWYHLFAPRPPRYRQATLPEREQIRRGRLGSILLLVQLIGIELPALFFVSLAPNRSIVLPWLIGCIFALLGAVAFNKAGKLTVTGILMIVSIEVTMMIKIWTVPGGISVSTLLQLAVLIQPILLAAALLPPWSAFVVAALNIAFAILCLTVGPHALDVKASLQTPALAGDLFAVPAMTSLLSAFFSWAIVRNLLGALKREYRADQFVRLEAQLLESKKTIEIQQQALLQGFEQFSHAMQTRANGQQQVQVELPIDHLLWPLAHLLNKELQRSEKAHVILAEHEATIQAINTLASEIYSASNEKRTLRLIRSNTPLDAVYGALHGVSTR